MTPHNQEHGMYLQELLQRGCRAKDLTIVVQIADNWRDFKETLTESLGESDDDEHGLAQKIQQIDQATSLSSFFLQAC